MARDEDDHFKKRRREEEKAAQRAENATNPGIAGIGEPSTSGLEDKLDELFKRATPLIEQLNSLYNQFLVGVETRPPLERRKQLDQLMVSIQMMSKPNPQQQFRANNIQSSYNTYRNRWDKMVKDIESGAIKRIAGPKKKAS